MTHLSWQEAAEGLQKRIEERCFVEGHRWEPIEGFGDACYWCHVLAAADDRAPSEEEREAA